jgi:hypothetical protein
MGNDRIVNRVAEILLGHVNAPEGAINDVARLVVEEILSGIGPNSPLGVTLEALRQIIEQTAPFKNEKHGVVPYVRRLAQSAVSKATGNGEITARRHRTDVEFFWLADHDAGMSEDHVAGVMFDQGQGAVCQICSAFHGRTFWAANVPPLDPDRDQDELITADTEEE